MCFVLLSLVSLCSGMCVVTAGEAGRVKVKQGPKCRQVGIRSEFI